MLYDLIPNMPEIRLRPLVERFAEMIQQSRTIADVFAVTYSPSSKSGIAKMRLFTPGADSCAPRRRGVTRRAKRRPSCKRKFSTLFVKLDA